jgi:UDP-N-acetylmuramyl pentapeptide synthase
MVRGALRKVLLHWLDRRAVELLRRHSPLVVAVTGSVGKSTTKSALSHVLDTSHRVMVSPYNAGVGLPLGIFGTKLPPHWYSAGAWCEAGRAVRRALASFPFDVLVLEVGVARPGQMERALGSLRPDIGVVTAVAPAHLQGFGTVETVLEEKWKLALASRTVVVNADDELLHMRASTLDPARVTGFGFERGDVRFRSLRRVDGRLAAVLSLGPEQREVETRMVARHSLYGLLAAAAVAFRLGLNPDEIAAGLSRAEPLRGRMRPLPGVKEALILDDSYNASPRAVLAALDTLVELAPRRRIALLGSMNELGTYEEEGHRLVGARVAAVADHLLTVGANARHFLAPEAVRGGMDAAAVASFDSPYEAGAHAAELLEPGDVVLVKGSRDGIFCEEAVKPLLREPETADRLLVRQTPAALAVKRKAFVRQAGSVSD